MSDTDAAQKDDYVNDTFGVHPATYATPPADASAPATDPATAAAPDAQSADPSTPATDPAASPDAQPATASDDHPADPSTPATDPATTPDDQPATDPAADSGDQPADPSTPATDPAAAPDDQPAAPSGAGKPVVPEHKILGTAQSARAAALLDKLPPADKAKYQAAQDAAKSDSEKQYLTKSLAAGHSVAEIEAFQKQIAGKDAAWMKDNLSLTGSSTGKGVQQQWSHSCNATTVEAVKGEMDPMYALKVHQDNPNFGKVDNADGAKDNPNLAADQKAMLTSTYHGAAAVDHAGVAASRDNPAKQGRGRWADDLLNKNQDVTGVKYENKQIGHGATVDDAVSSIDSSVSTGTPVPIVIGNGPDKFTHYVLVTASDAGPPPTYSIHDPASGETKIRTLDQMKQGKLDIAGSNQITAFEKPTPVAVK